MPLFTSEDTEILNGSTLPLFTVLSPNYIHEDNSDITSILVYANEGYVQWLQYNKKDIFPLENIVKTGVYTFYQFNSTNLDILGLVSGSSRENLTKKFKGRIFGKLIEKTTFNIIIPKSALVKIPVTVTRESLLNNSTLEEIKNVCKSSPDVRDKICNNLLFLGDLVNKYLISDLSDSREWARQVSPLQGEAKGKNLNDVIEEIELAQEWVNNDSPNKDVLLFDKIINQIPKDGEKFHNIRANIFSKLYKEAKNENYNEFKRYVRVLKSIDPQDAFTDILNDISELDKAVDQLVQMMTDLQFDETVKYLRTNHRFEELMALKHYLNEEDFNDAIEYRTPTDIDITSDIDANDNILFNLIEQVSDGAEIYYPVNKRLFILQPQPPMSVQQFIERFGNSQVVDGVTFTIDRNRTI